MPHPWTKPELIVWLRRKARRLGHLPGPGNILATKNGPGLKLFYTKFGSLVDAYLAAGLLKKDLIKGS